MYMLILGLMLLHSLISTMEKSWTECMDWIGMTMGLDTMQQLATKVLDEFYKNGLYTATNGKNGSTVVTKTKITDGQYKNGMNILKGLNVNGYTPRQQRKRDEENRKERNRSNNNNGGFQNLIL